MARDHKRDAHKNASEFVVCKVQRVPAGKHVVCVEPAFASLLLDDVDFAEDNNNNNDRAFDVDAIVDVAARVMRERHTTANADEVVSL